MRDKKEFYSILQEIHDKPFSEYARLVGDFDFSRYVLKVTQPPAEAQQRPSLFIVRVPQSIAGFPPHLYNSPVRRTALEDYLTRRIALQLEGLARYDEQGISRRRLSVAVPGQKILPRTSLLLTEEYVEARIYVQWPEREGRIDQALIMDVFFEDLPSVVNSALIFCNIHQAELEDFVNGMEDADQVRQLLPTRGLIAFAGEGSLLMRRGNSDDPDLETFQALTVSEDLQVEMEVPNGGIIKGLGVPSGITLILGDAYSGRTTMMRALAAGIYNHIPGDGRELVITVPDAVYVATEPGRAVQRVDISAFVAPLATGEDAELFSSATADACAAQAASTVEALEIGARVLLFDESDASPSFLSRDSRLNALMPDADKRIMPLSVRARQMADDLGISIVVGGSSAVAEFIPVADTILRIDDHKVYDVTREAKAMEGLAAQVSTDTARMTSLIEKNRWVVPSSIDPSMGPHDQVIEADGNDRLYFGRSVIHLQDVAQLADVHQMTTIGLILYYAKLRYLDEGRPMREILDLIDRDLSTEGLECLSRDLRGDLARPRRYEIAAALNRLDSLRISHVE